jgi:hypothetical protein
LDGQGIRVWFHEWTRDFSFLLSIQTGCGAHQTSCTMGTGDTFFFLGLKQLGHEADHWPPSSSEVKNCGTIPPLPHMSSQGSYMWMFFFYVLCSWEKFCPNCSSTILWHVYIKPE